MSPDVASRLALIVIGFSVLGYGAFCVLTPSAPEAPSAPAGQSVSVAPAPAPSTPDETSAAQLERARKFADYLARSRFEAVRAQGERADLALWDEHADRRGFVTRQRELEATIPALGSGTPAARSLSRLLVLNSEGSISMPKDGLYVDAVREELARDPAAGLDTVREALAQAPDAAARERSFMIQLAGSLGQSSERAREAAVEILRR